MILVKTRLETYCLKCQKKLDFWRQRFCSKKCRRSYRKVWKNQKLRLIVEDRDNGQCSRCGQFDFYWILDHKIAKVNGGAIDDLENLQTLCRECNKEKDKEDQLAFALGTYTLYCLPTSEVI